MAADPLIQNNPLSPITRQASQDRVLTFQKNASSIYNKYSVYEGQMGPGFKLGFKQPYVYTTVASSNFSKNITKFDSQVFPIGSTALDIKRVGKFIASGTGLLFIGKQYLLQQQGAFNETRIYNPLSLIAATAAPASLGLIERPLRFLPTSGTIGDMAKSSLQSLAGIQGDAMSSKPKGVATSESVISSKVTGIGTVKGLLRQETGQKALDRFISNWESGNTQRAGLLNSVKKMFPSTKPFTSALGKSEEWSIRPEYPKGNGSGRGVYEMMWDDKLKRLAFSEKNTRVSAVHVYLSPQSKSDTTSKYTDLSPESISKVGVYSYKNNIGINRQIDKLNNAAVSWDVNKFTNQTMPSAERISNVMDTEGNRYPSYKNIPTDRKGETFEKKMDRLHLTLTGRKFPTSPITSGMLGTADGINELRVLDGKRGIPPDKLIARGDGNQSLDLIFFYFFDLVNNKYIPFRATINSLNDINQAEWEDVTYMGRADKMYIYKGFTRNLTFSFTVYANSLRELHPMWDRVNYLIGLTRPSKYTSSSTGAIGEFMYPPMVSFRLGDMYNDQPTVITSVSLTIPDDAMWETFRGDGSKYNYLTGKALDGSSTGVSKFGGLKYGKGVQSLQLPTKIEISVSMNVMEKERSLTSDDHFAITTKVVQPRGVFAS